MAERSGEELAASGRVDGGTQSAAFTEPGHQGRLLSNYNYNLVQELSELLAGVWRIDEYLKDAGGQCDDCGKIWHEVRKRKELLVETVRQEIANHVEDGRFV